MNSKTPLTDAEEKKPAFSTSEWIKFARSLELRNAELTESLSKKQDDLDVQFGQLQESRKQVSKLTARIAELEREVDEANDFFGIYELLWKAFPSAGAGSTLKVAIKFAIKEHEELKAALAEARKDGQRIDAIIANKWTVAWNYLHDSFIIQAANQICGNIGHSKPLRELLDEAATPLPEKP